MIPCNRERKGERFEKLGEKPGVLDTGRVLCSLGIAKEAKPPVIDLKNNSKKPNWVLPENYNIIVECYPGVSEFYMGNWYSNYIILI